jgi:hypothetical protein
MNSLERIGYESLRFYGPFQPQHIEQLQITRTTTYSTKA